MLEFECWSLVVVRNGWFVMDDRILWRIGALSGAAEIGGSERVNQSWCGENGVERVGVCGCVWSGHRADLDG